MTTTSKKLENYLFSLSEARVIYIVGSGKMTIQELTKRYYRNQEKPIDANNKVASIVRRIVDKCEYHNLAWTIDGEGRGRHGKTIWKSKQGRAHGRKSNTTVTLKARKA